MATVEGLYTAEASGEPMTAHESVTFVAGGIEGDRYETGTGHYAPYDVCEVTLLDAASVETVAREHEIDISDGRHRRNVVTRGIDLRDVLDATVRIGDAVIRGTRPRPPCAYLEAVTGVDGIASALGDGRGGICADVLQPGPVAVGDGVTIVQPDPETAGRAIADRLADGEATRVSSDDSDASTTDAHPTDTH